MKLSLFDIFFLLLIPKNSSKSFSMMSKNLVMSEVREICQFLEAHAFSACSWVLLWYPNGCSGRIQCDTIALLNYVVILILKYAINYDSVKNVFDVMDKKIKVVLYCSTIHIHVFNAPITKWSIWICNFKMCDLKIMIWKCDF
jgi:hypothetical protein